MSQVTTHVLDAVTGTPAVGVSVSLQAADGTIIAHAATNADGRVSQFGPDALSAGRYRVVFDTAAYFAASGTATLYPSITIDFELADPAARYHVPLLLSPFAYSTYRGS
ncbi:MAG: 5-hydroxyisourate hydrolase [Microbacteriaceae bacterium]|nr:5-hydroxyisourate hydrolase [Microbacteriaceae bacterium]